ncbi:MAG: gamma-glutamylcyclotransferase [Hahellaceae bacterium]|nr:gamma-glutamylcyclotransferase [Hahellaceae bacterium]
MNEGAREEHLFVYGSLKPGESAEHFLAGIEGIWRQASVCGHHYPDGLPQTGGYPALSLDTRGHPVAGMVFSSSLLAGHWPLLDAYEGSAYTRVQTEVILRDDHTLWAWIYTVHSVVP